MKKESGLTKRQKMIIKMLAQFTADNPITIQAISEKLKLSSRTILREMPQIDAWFEENDFRLVKKPRVGLYVDEDQETRKFLQELIHMDQMKHGYTKEERQNRILLEILLVNEPLKYFYFTSLFHISDGTLSNDLDELEKWINHYNLELHRKPGIGISWTGNEENYRQVMIILLRRRIEGNSFSALQKDEELKKKNLFPHMNQQFLKEIQTIIRETQNVLDIQYTERSEFHLLLYLILTKHRIESGFEISKEGKDLSSMMHLPECQAANWIGSKMGMMVGHPVSEGEIYCIAIQLLSAKIWRNKNDSKYDEDSFRVRQIVIKIVLNMEKLLETDFLDNEALIDGLCNHMRPAVNRMKMNLFIENGSIELLKEKYHYIYDAAKAACGFLRKELEIEKVPEGELGFIALYFCVAVEEKQAEEAKISVCIACPHGVGTSHMLSVHVQREFPDIKVQRIISTADLNPEELEALGIDLVISTAELDIPYPNVHVNSVLTDSDKGLIRNKLAGVQKKKSITKLKTKPKKTGNRIRKQDIYYMTLLGQEIIQVLDNIKISSEESVENKEQLIWYAAKLFARTDELAEIIEKDLLKREDISTTYIPNMNILFLHSETKGVKHCRFGYIALKRMICDYGQNICGAVLMLIPKGKEIKIYREVMSEISGALAEKDQIITYLYDKDRKNVEEQLESSLGSYYEKIMRRKGKEGGTKT